MNILIRSIRGQVLVRRRRFKTSLLPYWIYWPQKILMFAFSALKEMGKGESLKLGLPLVIGVIIGLTSKNWESAKGILSHFFHSPLFILAIITAILGTLKRALKRKTGAGSRRRMRRMRVKKIGRTEIR